MTLNAYSRKLRFVAREYAEGDRIEPAIDRLLSEPGVEYIQVHDTEAGCYDFRIVPATIRAQ